MSTNQPQLVVLIPGFPSDETDVNCLPFHQSLLQEIHRQSKDITLVVFAFQYPFEEREYQWHDIPVKCYGGRNRKKIRRILFRYRVLRDLKKRLRHRQIKGILSFWMGECAWAGVKLSETYSVPHFCWLMGQDAGPDNKYVAEIKPQPEQLIAISDFNRDKFSSHYGIIPAHLISPGIRESVFPPAFPDKDIDILGVGNLIPLKAYDVFIRVIAALREKNPQIRCLLCGNGPERSRLETQIRQSGLEAQLTLTGELPHHEVLSLMTRARILLHPSSYEGFSLSCLEALYAGMKVVSFIHPMNTPIKNWEVVADEKAMIEKTIQLMGSKQAHERFLYRSIGQTARELIDLFAQQ